MWLWRRNCSTYLVCGSGVDVAANAHREYLDELNAQGDWACRAEFPLTAGWERLLHGEIFVEVSLFR